MLNFSLNVERIDLLLAERDTLGDQHVPHDRRLDVPLAIRVEEPERPQQLLLREGSDVCARAWVGWGWYTKRIGGGQEEEEGGREEGA